MLPFKTILFERYSPEIMVLYGGPQAREILAPVSFYLEGKTTGEDYAKIYVCTKQTCLPPVLSISEFLKLMDDAER